MDERPRRRDGDGLSFQDRFAEEEPQVVNGADAQPPERQLRENKDLDGNAPEAESAKAQPPPARGQAKKHQQAGKHQSAAQLEVAPRLDQCIRGCRIAADDAAKIVGQEFCETLPGIAQALKQRRRTD